VTDKLVVNLPALLERNQAFTLEVDYRGKPTFRKSPYVYFLDHLGLFFNTEARRIYVIAEPDGARFWFPCNDHPRDKALFRFELTVPEELTAVANGELVETHTEVPNAFKNGAAGDLYIWEHSYPMATYLASIAVGNYVLVDGVSPAGVPLRSYVFPEQKAAFESLIPMIGSNLDWMSETFGPYPFEAFGYVSIDSLGDSMENQTLVALSELDPSIMVHEMAHMWFGDWTSPDSWADVWRNEGFATYVQAWSAAQTSPAALDEAVRQWETVLSSPLSGIPLNRQPKEALFGDQSYARGALLVNALRKEMGDEAFLAGLRLYFQRYSDGTATHAQFQSALEEAAGKPLQAFFSSWIGQR
jgi:aminopeptidase N